ncbi:class F sortase [Streptomyces sp. 549]|uniref:class F sortase n=1 Tax=Streptomyces sp. 549 TaxID=3049076 RepID=UPI0024C2950E|nr:class F sortase [Streptomyces sp. 549]MDK1473759.1 class F sortase [Streptomyces sp. 549]
MSEETRSAGSGRLMTGAAWAVLLLALWLWGKDLTDGDFGVPVFGDVSRSAQTADGRPLPPAHAPLPDAAGPRAAPVLMEIEQLGVRAQVVRRGLDADGAIDPPPLSRAENVGWYGAGPAPGAAGAALLVGHVDTESTRAVFYGLSTVEPGTQVRVTRADGTTAEFTVESVDVLQRRNFDAAKAYQARDDGRAELRIITCGGSFDREQRAYTANVVVSAYLTGTGSAPGGAA